ncbi:MAG: TIGR03435 family protein [Edaphobacter sp.]
MTLFFAACTLLAAQSLHSLASAAAPPPHPVPATGGQTSAAPAPAASEPPAFEVATIKPSPAGSGFVNFDVSPARFKVVNGTLKECIQFAYNINSDDQIGKGPDWMSSKKFDIDAKMGDAEAEAIGKLPPGERIDQYRLMVQSLLAERFDLRISKTAKERPVLALVATKNGPKLTPAAALNGAPQLFGGSRGDLTAKSVSMNFFANFFLSGRSDLGGRVAIDATGLKGSYDFTLKWSSGDASPALPEGSAAGDSPAFVTALQEQLGLKLESRKAPVEVLEIDHVEQPSPN